MKRRDFIKSTGLASTALMVPSFIRASKNSNSAYTRNGKILIVIQLSGGNDGLNTIIPYEDDLYYNYRPTIGIEQKEVIKVGQGGLGFNPAMSSLRELYDEGYVSILNNVGYPNPDRSHFRSMDIWHTASSSDEYLQNGWLGRYLDHNCPTPYHAIELDDTVSLSLKGAIKNGFAMSNPKRLKKTTSNPFLKAVASNYQETDNANLHYLYKTLIETQSSANYLFEQSKVHTSKTAYPETPFGRDLKLIAELITADTSTEIYYVSLTGFDTHANQKGTHAKLLQQYSEGVAALVKDLKSHDLFKDTLILTFSEFGRRVKQNASNGTDHGTANNLFVIGEQLQSKGFFNGGPNLSKLDQDDLIFDIDFRSVYATLLEKWLEADIAGVLGNRFPTLPFL